VDTDLTEGVLTIEFESEERFVLNVHGPATEIWLSANRRAWHFALRGNEFVSTAAGSEPLLGVLSALVGEKLGRPIVLAAKPG
jgi:iron donor protein CyaY